MSSYHESTFRPKPREGVVQLAPARMLAALEAQGTPADAPLLAWLAEHYQPGMPWGVLSNPTDRIRLLLRGVGTARAWWGDGAEQTETLMSGSDTTFERVYGSAATRGVVVLGDVRELRATAAGGLTSFGGDIAGLPTGLTYLLVTGSNTLSGDIANLPTALTILDVWGSNELSGDIAGLPTGLTYLSVQGSNELSGDIASLPTDLTYLRVLGSNTLSGDIASLPTDLTYLSVLGSNELSGDIASLPTDLTYLFVLGSNTLSAPTTVLPAPLSYCRVSRLTNLEGSRYVDNVLAGMVAIINETKPRADRVVQLNEGGAHAPTAAGLADRDTLVAAGYTVSVAS